MAGEIDTYHNGRATFLGDNLLTCHTIRAIGGGGCLRCVAVHVRVEKVNAMMCSKWELKWNGMKWETRWGLYNRAQYDCIKRESIYLPLFDVWVLLLMLLNDNNQACVCKSNTTRQCLIWCQAWTNTPQQHMRMCVCVCVGTATWSGSVCVCAHSWHLITSWSVCLDDVDMIIHHHHHHHSFPVLMAG